MKVKGGYKWGKSGKVYKTREGAAAQAKAAYASGYKKKPKKRKLPKRGQRVRTNRRTRRGK